MTLQAILDRFIPKKLIVNCERQPYLHRWYLFRSERVSLFLHKFVRSDEDRALHDHPWAFIVIPIWRGYIEHNERERSWIEKFDWLTHESSNDELGFDDVPPQPNKTRVYPIIGARIRPATYRHRVELIDGKPAWSLFIRFRKIREWGFWLPEGFTLWNKFWQDKCE